MDTELKHIQTIIRHIRKVQDNCFLLGERLIEAGESRLGRELIANGLIHDHSKFFGLEFDALRVGYKDKKILAAAVKQHNETNNHHPERWGSIHSMHDVYLAECVCDWKARSDEFGNKTLMDWIDEEATKRFGFKANDETYKRIERFVKLLLDEPFKAK